MLNADGIIIMNETEGTINTLIEHAKKTNRLRKNNKKITR